MTFLEIYKKILIFLNFIIFKFYLKVITEILYIVLFSQSYVSHYFILHPNRELNLLIFMESFFHIKVIIIMF